MGKQTEKQQPKVDLEEAPDIIGADAADQTTGSPETPEEWVEEQPLRDEPTRPLDAGEPSPFQPAAATPETEEEPEEAEENRSADSR